MQALYAIQSASISELKKNPTRLIENAQGLPVAILNHNTAAAYLIPASTFEQLMDLVDENELYKIVKQRLKAPFKAIKVDINEI